MAEKKEEKKLSLEALQERVATLREFVDKSISELEKIAKEKPVESSLLGFLAGLLLGLMIGVIVGRKR
ncbi:TPA: hypothetical protein EYP26_03780 [Candidatus Bathyarchaeota archaeon]|nr:hypothetical protein [Candidatus Bathyarchaeota archaeon]